MAVPNSASSNIFTVPPLDMSRPSSSGFILRTSLQSLKTSKQKPVFFPPANCILNERIITSMFSSCPLWLPLMTVTWACCPWIWSKRKREYICSHHVVILWFDIKISYHRYADRVREQAGSGKGTSQGNPVHPNVSLQLWRNKPQHFDLLPFLIFPLHN